MLIQQRLAIACSYFVEFFFCKACVAEETLCVGAQIRNGCGSAVARRLYARFRCLPESNASPASLHLFYPELHQSAERQHGIMVFVAVIKELAEERFGGTVFRRKWC